MLKCAGRFFITMTQIPFNKSYSHPKDLVSLLKTRGLVIADDAKAQHYLTHIGYYRLSAYMYPFLEMPKELHHFKKGVTFDRVMRLYRFDRKLRLLVFNEIEKIEVAIRSAVVNIGSEMTDNPFWITDVSNFIDKGRHVRTISLIDNELRHSTEDFITHFKETYCDPFPPAWILAEVLPFGVITNIYSNIKDKKIKKRISQSFGLQIKPFESWLSIIVGQRNSCGHHARIWNKKYSNKVMLPEKITAPWILLPTDTQKEYFTICILKYFLNTISPGNDLYDKLCKLLSQYPEIDTSAMGFPQDWENESLWR